MRRTFSISSLFFFNDTATTEIYTLSLHDALPILGVGDDRPRADGAAEGPAGADPRGQGPNCVRVPKSVRKQDRKSTRLNSSHGYISYAVFCLKKKKKDITSLTVVYILQ